MNIPIRQLDSVYHLGELDVAKRGERFRNSLEGDGLSVSLCPDAWRRIAKLGGSPLWRLDRAGGRFLDVHALVDDPRFETMRATVERWALAGDWVRRVDRYRAWQFDDEADNWMYSLHSSRADAAEEVEGNGFALNDVRDSGEPVLQCVEIVEPTERMIARLGLIPDVHDDGLGYAGILWARDVLAQHLDNPIDGAWWDELYAPACLSAPRGAIFPEAQHRWVEIIPLDEPDEDELLDGLPGIDVLVFEPDARNVKDVSEEDWLIDSGQSSSASEQALRF